MLTDWEIGNDLLGIVGLIDEKIGEIAETNPLIADKLHQCSMVIGKSFNDLNAHGFGLMDWRQCNCESCCAKRGV